MTNFLFKLTSRRWIGRCIMIVAVIHMAFTYILAPGLFPEIIATGVLNSVTAENAAGVWFFLFGLPLFLIGLVVNWAEKDDRISLPCSLTWGLLGLTFLGIILMPASGFYLLIPALIGLSAKNYADEKSACWARFKRPS
ncbi:DUF6463 family protein [Paremcibacter congregatus]|uniref:DUF6463 family protein n=1 Tax=Paremcibacter congregatus TaxID=2043170 RepID=UPI0030EC9365|tara:strand:- start:6256 stop:6672 length:417 start_codon:yes stop_codon:yes gene_type:complete